MQRLMLTRYDRDELTVFGCILAFALGAGAVAMGWTFVSSGIFLVPLAAISFIALFSLVRRKIRWIVGSQVRESLGIDVYESEWTMTRLRGWEKRNGIEVERTTHHPRRSRRKGHS
jgi:hypothetical protein